MTVGRSRRQCEADVTAPTMGAPGKIDRPETIAVILPALGVPDWLSACTIAGLFSRCG